MNQANRFQTEKIRTRDPVTGVIRGAEAFDFGSGRHAMLFLHGWTSSPRELRFLAEKVSGLGLHCRGLLLKGHGLTLADLAPTRYQDYLTQALGAFDELAQTHEAVSICGLSMGGLMGLDLALQRKVANLILIAPFLRPWGRTFGLPNAWLVGRVPLWGNISKSIAGPILDGIAAQGHIAYHAMPAAAMVSVVAAARTFRGRESRITCPTLIHHAVNDTTSAFSGSLELMQGLGSPDRTLRVFNRSNHILTLDHDRQALEDETLAWLARHADTSGL